MRRAVQCPSCGANHDLKNPGISAISCEYCKTLFYWDEQAVHDSGQKAILDEPSSALRVGEPCTLEGKDHMVLGRVRYSYGGGVWDEWFLDGPSQEIVWLTEDEKEFAIERPVAADPGAPRFQELSVGQTITLHNKPFMVEELGKAACLGVEGQVPWVVIPNEVYPFADLASPDGSMSLGLEFDEGGPASIYQGKFLARDALKVHGEPAMAEVVLAGTGVRCAGCGAPVDGTFPPDTEMLVCQSCGSGRELSATHTKVVSKNPEKPSFTLEIGDVGTFDKAKFEVVGRLRYVETEWGATYISDEYLLWHEKAGYLWLEESERHWVRNKRSHRQPGVDLFAFMSPKDKVQIGDETYRFVEQGEETLHYVDGALPWVARVGERFRYADLIQPPKSFGAEISVTGESKEIEFFEGTYIAPEEMKQAFGRDFDKPYGVAPSQPFIRTASQKFMMLVGIVVALLNLGFIGVSCQRTGRTVLNVQITPQQYRSQHITQPFKIRYKPAVLKISGSAPVSNSWVAVDIGLVNAKDEVCLETDGDASYYSGVEGGESWSEGSRSFSRYVRVDKPGDYRVLVYGAAGTGENPDSAGGPPLTLRVKEGVMPSKFFLWMLILAALYPAKEIIRKSSFEKRRFPSDDDDDDDD